MSPRRPDEVSEPRVMALGAAIQGLASRGFREAMLWVLATNARARRFYEMAGWQPDGGAKIEREGEVELREVRYRGKLAELDRARFDLVIFDCDGVLVDSDRIAVRIDAQVITEAGWPITEAEVVQRFLGRSDADQLAEIERHLGHPLPSDWLERCEPLYREAFERELRPVEGVPEMLASLDIPSCVASSGSHEKTRYTLTKCGLYDLFVGRIFSVSEVARGKPAPDLFLHAASCMGADASGCAVVEDSPAGVEAARAAGMWAFAFAGGLTPASALAGARTSVFSEMRQLGPLLREWRGNV